MKSKLFRQFAVSAGLLCAGAGEAAEYRFTDLGTLESLNPFASSYARAINNSGQIAGYATVGGGQSPVLWNGTVATNLGRGSLGLAINSSGQVVGWEYSSPGQYAMLWNGTTPTELGRVRNSVATGINDSGQIVGWTQDVNAGGFSPPYRPTIWNGTTASDLGTLGGAIGVASSINNKGQAVGGYSYGTYNHAIRWDNTVPIDINPTWALGSFAQDINDKGQTVGSSAITVGGGSSFRYATRATLWDGETAFNLGESVPLPTCTTYYGDPFVPDSAASAINNIGQVLGVYGCNGLTDYASPQSFLWDGTSFKDLNSLLSESDRSAGWRIRRAYDINDSGQIVGDADYIKNGSYFSVHGFLLTPASVPEPATYSMAALGAVLIGAVSRRRKKVG